MNEESLSHVDQDGAARMVDVGQKEVTRRVAKAIAIVSMQEKTLSQINANEIAKGDVIQVARIAGIMAAKRTSELIPLCHPIALSSVNLEFAFAVQSSGNHSLEIYATAIANQKTGVEMEALTAVSVAALTIYDMCKAIDREMSIIRVQLLEKTGGKSDYLLSG